VDGMRALGFNKTYNLPFNAAIPNSTNAVLNKKSQSSRIKFYKRCLYLRMKGQVLLETNKILPQHKNILWINFSAPSLGDSLMDLSSRAMLSDRNIDLLTNKKNAHIYENDIYFSAIFNSPNQINSQHYDLVILDSYSTRSVRIKAQVAFNVPFVGMFGFFNGPEVNRVLFSFHQMNSLLGNLKKVSDINRIAMPSIFISDEDYQIIENLDLPEHYIVIVVGGEWNFRTYNSWDRVIEELLKLENNTKIVLVGSYNGIEISNLLQGKFKDGQLINYVSKLSFNQTAQILKQSKYTICCDGGLMHAANSLGVSSVVLLAKLDEDMQLTKASKCLSLFDDMNVNNISIEDIINKCKKISKFYHNHPQVE
jgi:ADP-heptose:LPS heptosyltransferase